MLTIPSYLLSLKTHEKLILEVFDKPLVKLVVVTSDKIIGEELSRKRYDGCVDWMLTAPSNKMVTELSMLTPLLDKPSDTKLALFRSSK